MSSTLDRTTTASTWVAPLSAGLLAIGVAQLWSWLSPLMLALVIGALLANLAAPSLVARLADPAQIKLMLRLGIVLLGFRLSLSHLGEIGIHGVLIALATVGVTFVTIRAVGARMGVDAGLTTLIAAGTSICGAAAIASVQDGVRATQREVALALAIITVFGTAMIGVVPLAADLIGLSERDAGIWAGASIHEVAQVVAAGSIIGGGALAVAVSVKLTRVLLLAPVHALAVRNGTSDDVRTPLLPWYVVGFLAAVLVHSAGVLPQVALTGLSHAANLLLSAAMFGLGLGIAVLDLWPVPWRVLLLGLTGTVVVTGVPLIALLLL